MTIRRNKDSKEEYASECYLYERRVMPLRSDEVTLLRLSSSCLSNLDKVGTALAQDLGTLSGEQALRYEPRDGDLHE